MNDTTEDDLDALLRDHFEGPVPDDGFCSRVIDQLPARRRRITWPLVAGALTGVATCWLSLASAPIAYAGWQDWLAGEPSASTLALFAAMMSMVILALVWAVAEADDRHDLLSRRTLR